MRVPDLRASGFGELRNSAGTAHVVLHSATQGASAVPALGASATARPTSSMPLAGYGYSSPTDVELSATSPVAQRTASTYIVAASRFHGFRATATTGPARRRRGRLDDMYAKLVC
jgi:hypothetical protein